MASLVWFQNYPQNEVSLSFLTLNINVLIWNHFFVPSFLKTLNLILSWDRQVLWPLTLEDTGAVDGGFVADDLQQCLHVGLELHQLICFGLQRALVLLIRLLQVWENKQREDCEATNKNKNNRQEKEKRGKQHIETCVSFSFGVSAGYCSQFT